MSVNMMSIAVTDLHRAIASSPLGVSTNDVARFPEFVCNPASNKKFVLDYENNPRLMAICR